MAKRKRKMSANLGEVTKKDFVAIANILCGSGAPEGTVEALGNYFASANPRFDRARFERASRCDRQAPKSRTRSQWTQD